MAVAGLVSRIITSGQARPSLIVTKDGKRPRTLLVDTWKKILRLQRECKAEGFRAVFVCPDCNAPITMSVPHPRNPQLTCRCTTWMGR